MERAELFYKSTCLLGESILWDEQRNDLYWTDILNKQLFKLSAYREVADVWQFDRYVSKIFKDSQEKRQFILAMQGGLFTWSEGDGLGRAIVEIETEGGLIRTNDGGIDPEGNIWIGTMHLEAEPNRGKLYRLHDHKLTPMLEPVTIPNGIVWLDGYTYFIDTKTCEIRKYCFDSGICETIIQIPADIGMPDGMCLGPDGLAWVAHWGGGCVCAWNLSNGMLEHHIQVDAPHVTSCIFGGDSGKELFISTARIGLNEEELLKYPNSGSIFRYLLT